MKVNEIREKINEFIDKIDDEELKGQALDLLQSLEECENEASLNHIYKRFLVDNELEECEECGKINFRADMICTWDNDYICQNCFDKGWSCCDHCGLAVYPDDFMSVDDGNEYWCQNCIDNDAHWCDGCETYVSDFTYTIYTSADRSSSAEWCQGCYESGDAYYCDECGQYYTYDCGDYDEDSDAWYCEECSCGHCDVIHNYSYKPTPIFRKTNDEQNIQNDNLCFFGVETEVDGKCGVRRDDAVKDLVTILDDFFYYKKDGSLNYGFECVSHPATINYWLENKETITRAFESLVNNDFRSHQTSTCGFHIHASRKYLGNTLKEQEDTINKILLILESFRPQIERFSRRKDYHWSQFLSDRATSNNYMKDKADIANIKVIDKVKQQATGRYAVLNLNNLNTIELRVLRGTLNIETFIAGLQFFKNIIDIAKTKTEKQLNGLKWGKIINYNKDFTELKAYNKRRGIDNDAILVVNKTPQTLVIGDKVKVHDNGNLNYTEKDLCFSSACGTITGMYYHDYVVSFTKTEIKRVNKWLKQIGREPITMPDDHKSFCVSISAEKLEKNIKSEIESGEQ